MQNGPGDLNQSLKKAKELGIALLNALQPILRGGADMATVFVLFKIIASGKEEEVNEICLNYVINPIALTSAINEILKQKEFRTAHFWEALMNSVQFSGVVIPIAFQMIAAIQRAKDHLNKDEPVFISNVGAGLVIAMCLFLSGLDGIHFFNQKRIGQGQDQIQNKLNQFANHPLVRNTLFALYGGASINQIANTITSMTSMTPTDELTHEFLQSGSFLLGGGLSVAATLHPNPQIQTYLRNFFYGATTGAFTAFFWGYLHDLIEKNPTMDYQTAFIFAGISSLIAVQFISYMQSAPAVQQGRGAPILNHFNNLRVEEVEEEVEEEEEEEVDAELGMRGPGHN